MNLTLMKIACYVSLGIALTGFAFLLAGIRVPPEPRLGRRGGERRRCLDQGGAFYLFEPLIRYVAGFFSLLPLSRLRAIQEQRLRQAGYFLGLTPDELSALSFLSAALLSSSVAFICRMIDESASPAIVAALLGAHLPYLKIREVRRERCKEITRGLPQAIEIAAMCMGAGLDFPGSLRLLSRPAGGSSSALSDEFAAILEELDLGHTRREALENFAERVPVSSVRDFVSSVVQAEQKGSPLAKVLQVQGHMLSMRRSVAAEEAAARSGVFMVVPMMLLVGCVLLLLMGPFIVNGIGF